MRVHLVVVVTILLLTYPALANAQAAVDFDDLVTDTNYYVGDTFVSNGIEISLDALSSTYLSGHCTIISDGYACGSGNEAWTGNVMLHFGFGSISGLSLLFGNYGGYTKVEVNGDTQKIYNMLDLDGVQIGGVNASVTQSALTGNVHGCLTLSGPISSFGIGGQEFAIDNVTEVPEPSTALSLVTICSALLGISKMRRRHVL
ncbi:PEP-CTERM sorting domain-containing protein [bacterium]|nr:PEP-CTERM sorting domain-containing protein [bacterium]